MPTLVHKPNIIKAWRNATFNRPLISSRRNMAVITAHAERPKNEDGFLVIDQQRKVLAVGDGMGGREGGMEACQIALETLELGVTQNSKRHLGAIIRQANEAIIKAAAADASLEQMGTTLVALEIRDNRVDIFNVGDSRAFLHKHSGEIGLLTIDQSVSAEIHQDLEEIKSFPIPFFDNGKLYEYTRNIPRLGTLTSRMGSKQMRLFNRFTFIEPGDRLLLCSDGLHGYLPYKFFAEILTQHSSLEETVTQLFHASLGYMKLHRERGGIGDNFTAVLYEQMD